MKGRRARLRIPDPRATVVGVFPHGPHSGGSPMDVTQSHSPALGGHVYMYSGLYGTVHAEDGTGRIPGAEEPRRVTKGLAEEARPRETANGPRELHCLSRCRLQSLGYGRPKVAAVWYRRDGVDERLALASTGNGERGRGRGVSRTGAGSPSRGCGLGRTCEPGSGAGLTPEGPGAEFCSGTKAFPLPLALLAGRVHRGPVFGSALRLSAVLNKSSCKSKSRRCCHDDATYPNHRYHTNHGAALWPTKLWIAPTLPESGAHWARMRGGNR